MTDLTAATHETVTITFRVNKPLIALLRAFRRRWMAMSAAGERQLGVPHTTVEEAAANRERERQSGSPVFRPST